MRGTGASQAVAWSTGEYSHRSGVDLFNVKEQVSAEVTGEVLAVVGMRELQEQNVTWTVWM